MNNIVVGRQKDIRGSYRSEKSFQEKAAQIIAEMIIRSYVAFRVIKKSISKSLIYIKPYVKIIGKSFIAFNVLVLSLLWSIMKLIPIIMQKACPVIKSDTRELGIQLVLMIRDNKRKIAKVMWLTTASLVVGSFTVLFIIGVTGIYQKYDFTKVNWNNNPSSRIDMIDSFMSKYNVDSMNQIEIENLLGNPEVTTKKEECEFKALRDYDFDEVVEYQLNDGSRSIFNIIEKHYAIAYKDGEVAWSDVIISDSMHKDIDDEIISAKAN